MLGVRITDAGGRVVTVDTPELHARIADGVVELWEPREPGPKPNPTRHLTDAQRATVAARLAICTPCDQNLGTTDLTVKCKECGCAGVSFLHGECKRGEWPAP